MAATQPAMEPLRWTMNEALCTYLSGLSGRLHINNAVVVRMFVMHLREDEPVTRSLLLHFVELGMRDAVVEPRVVKVFLERDLLAWLHELVAGLRHPSYPKFVVRVRHLLAGYVLYLRQHEAECVRYGTIRLASRAS